MHSPVRFELYTLAEGAAPCSITDLARLSGRGASTLYRHVASLEKAGFLVAIGKRRAGRRFETVYGLGPAASAPSLGPKPAKVVAPLRRMLRGAMRAAERDISGALDAGHYPRLGDPDSPVRLFYEMTWLDSVRKRRLHALLSEVLALVREGRAERTGEPYRITGSVAILSKRV